MFKKWCSTQGFIGRFPSTHVLMDGGVLNVPFDRLDDFYDACVQCIKMGEHIFVVEQKTDVYNFFLDVDYKAAYPLELTDVKMIALDVCAKVESLGLPPDCIISVAKPKKKESLIKTGIHFNWPNLPVNQVGAVSLMYHIIHTLNISRQGDWSKFVDNSVYGDVETETKGSGFRMPWCHKKGKHESCNGRGCMVCENTGKLTEGEYIPIFKYIDTGIQECSHEPTLEGFKSTTIRCQSEPITIPQSPTIVKKTVKEGSFTSAQTKDEFEDNELKVHVETFIRKFLDGQSRSRVKKIFKHKDTYLVDTTSKYCENILRTHNSNHVWFLIKPDGTIRQRCFCRCETMQGRRQGYCKDFSGRAHFLNKTICDILYPNGKNVKSSNFCGVCTGGNKLSGGSSKKQKS